MTKKTSSVKYGEEIRLLAAQGLLDEPARRGRESRSSQVKSTY